MGSDTGDTFPIHISLPFFKRQILDSTKLKEFADDNITSDENGEKEKSFVTNNFSFSHSVFRRLVLQMRKNQGLFGKGLISLLEMPFILQ